MLAFTALRVGGAIVQGDPALGGAALLDRDHALVERRDHPGADVDLLEVGSAAGAERDDQKAEQTRKPQAS